MEDIEKIFFDFRKEKPETALLKGSLSWNLILLAKMLRVLMEDHSYYSLTFIHFTDCSSK